MYRGIGRAAMLSLQLEIDTRCVVLNENHQDDDVCFGVHNTRNDLE